MASIHRRARRLRRVLIQRSIQWHACTHEFIIYSRMSDNSQHLICHKCGMPKDGEY